MGGFRATTDERTGRSGLSDVVVTDSRFKHLLIRNGRTGWCMEQGSGGIALSRARLCVSIPSRGAGGLRRLRRDSASYG